ncbi:LysR family transcriptional regulator [Klebsiella pneumoniae]|nr:LysR family transcriptional regulator [Klebsiella pneumoniae]
MSDAISDLRLLVELVAAGSLTRAAHVLDSSLPAVSRRLAAMEARLGVRLIERHARRFQLTEEGGRLHERALRILAEVEEAEAEASARGTVRGRLRIGTLHGLGRQHICALVAEFAARHPLLEMELRLSDKPDLIEDDIDLALQIDPPQSPRLVSRRLMSSRRAIIASPNYLRQAPPLRHPNDLLHHRCICLVRGHRALDRWTFAEDGRLREIQVPHHLLCDSGEITRAWALAGHGVAMKLLWDIDEDLASGRLRECLGDYTHERIKLFAVYPQQRYLPARISAFLAFIDERMGDQASGGSKSG